MGAIQHARDPSQKHAWTQFITPTIHHTRNHSENPAPTRFHRMRNHVPSNDKDRVGRMS